jgi:hypothetical protein
MSVIKNPKKSDKRRFMDVQLLKRQAEFVGREIEASQEMRRPLSKQEKRLLEELWELLHVILDDLSVGRECVLELSERRR